MAITRIGNPAIADQRGVNFRNIIINGGMDIAQRGTSESGVTASTFVTDRNRFIPVTAGTWTVSQDTDVPTGQGFAKSSKLQCTTANTSLAADSSIVFQQRFEGQNLQYLKKGTANAESLTLSFWIKSTKTGTAVAELVDRDNTRQISKSYTISSANIWEKKTITFAGDTTGTLDNDNARSFDLQLWYVAGTDFSSGTLTTSWNTYSTSVNRAVGVTNFADSTSNIIYITGVQLEAGQVASDFEFLPTDVNEERCRRYFQKSYTRGEYAGTATNSAMITTARLQNTVSNRPTNVFFRPIMRATPTMTIYSVNGTSGRVSDLDTGTSHSRDETANAAVLSSMGMGYLTGVGGLTAGDGMGFHYTADAEL